MSVKEEKKGATAPAVLDSVELNNIVFFERDFVNRSITNTNVYDLYESIKNRGFQPEVSKIHYFQGEVIKDEKLFRVKVGVKKGLTKEVKDLTCKDFEFSFEPIQWSPDLKPIVDGQHKTIALMLLKILKGDDTITNDAIYQQRSLPDGYSIPEFISLLNSGKSWTINDINATNISTGNEILDTILRIAKDGKLETQAAVDFYTIKTGSLTTKTISRMKSKIGSLPNSVTLDKHCIENGNKLLLAFEQHAFIDSSKYNNTRFSKGMKQFVKESKLSVNNLIALINKITKKEWETYFIPADGSTMEAKAYKNGFTSLKSLRD